jgi:AmmeMemoRadiSam system protein B
VAGTFYPDDPGELRETVEGFLSTVQAERRPATAAIVPHAGLVYSGACAATVFAQIELPEVAVIVAPNHTGRGRRMVSIWASGGFRTPLGVTPVAEDFLAQLSAAFPAAVHDPAAHDAEHAIEVELPFLAVQSPSTAIAPIVLATDGWDVCQALGRALADVAKTWPQPVCLIASSDMTHYESASSAEAKDRLALAKVAALDGRGLLEVCQRGGITMCGRAPAATVLEAARELGAKEATVVDYRHSGMVTGDDRHIVAYAGVVIE